MDPSAAILALYSSPAAHRIYDEAVTEAEHALQAAMLAEAAGASPSLVAAALLHDVGHLVGGDLAPAGGSREGDSRHEGVGAQYLSRWFGPEVSEPVALHVMAKRYLCSVDETYSSTLSPASVRSLAVQGGPLTTSQVATFRSNPMWEDAIALRRWDDEAKLQDMEIPDFEEWLPLIRQLSRRGRQGTT